MEIEDEVEIAYGPAREQREQVRDIGKALAEGAIRNVLRRHDHARLTKAEFDSLVAIEIATKTAELFEVPRRRPLLWRVLIGASYLCAFVLLVFALFRIMF